MEPVYFKKRFIKSADDLPKDGTYFAYLASAHQVSLMKMSTGYKPFWIEDVEWFFEPVEMPTEEEINIIIHKLICYPYEKIPMRNLANWLLSKLR